jgi:LPXTG-motif cell wall-anchored protein
VRCRSTNARCARSSYGSASSAARRALAAVESSPAVRALAAVAWHSSEKALRTRSRVAVHQSSSGIVGERNAVGGGRPPAAAGAGLLRPAPRRWTPVVAARSTPPPGTAPDRRRPVRSRATRCHGRPRRRTTAGTPHQDRVSGGPSRSPPTTGSRPPPAPTTPVITTLPETGTDAGSWLAVALGLILIGSLSLRITQRSRRPDRSLP